MTGPAGANSGDGWADGIHRTGGWDSGTNGIDRWADGTYDVD